MIKIEITVPDTYPANMVDEYLSSIMKALGFIRTSALMLTPAQIATEEVVRAETRAAYEGQEIGETIVVDTSKPEGAAIVAAAHAETERVQKELDTPLYAPVTNAMDGDRERGKAGPGHRRRTNEQIKADDAYFAAHPQSAPLAPGTEAPLISTGEERISPEDAADEAAETAARAGEKLTIEDLRAAVGRYTEKFGAKASIENIRVILGKPMIEVAEGDIAAAIARVEAAISGSPDPMGVASAEPIADKPTEPVHATKADVVEAFTAYGKKYDGTDDPKLMALTQQDLPKVLEATFGAGIKALSKIPQTPEGYGKAMTAVYEAVRDNPFKRTPK